MQDNDIVKRIQSACKVSHNNETALLRVYFDMLFSIDQDGSSVLSLLDLSYAFDTIDHAVFLNL